MYDNGGGCVAMVGLEMLLLLMRENLYETEFK